MTNDALYTLENKRALLINKARIFLLNLYSNDM